MMTAALESIEPNKQIPTDPSHRRMLLAEMMTQKQRRAFGALERKSYFNFGAQGILPQPGLTAISNYFQRLDLNAPFSVDTGLANLELSRSVRTAISGELGGKPEHYSLVDNTTTGCNIVLWGLNWREGDRLIVTENEYPGIIAAVNLLRDHYNLHVDVCPVYSDTVNFLEALDSMIRPETRLIVASHVTWDTGAVLPIAEMADICRNYEDQGLRLLVDGAQSVGVLPLDLDTLKADYYAFPGHKWWCGPEGTGALYVRPEAHEDLKPTFAGPRGLAFDKEGDFLGFHGDGRRFEVSTTCMALYSGLEATLKLHNSWGSPQARYKRIRNLTRTFLTQLRKLVPHLELLDEKNEPRAGLICLKPNNVTPHRLARMLEVQGVMVRNIAPTNCLRVSIHYLTLHKELNELAGMLSRMATSTDGERSICQ